ncbi:hypothetical protein RIF29_30059 [Crotalaria pallida]|uniref:Bifunctional inhibitor/plant lipid transfer protein/seed storage helical domain-containing protein n=1 Tax=Crotalaria pallida TaxID=3830 RepID=A0AAN9EKT6_CROPI
MNPLDSKVVCTFIIPSFLFFTCVAVDNLPCPPKSTTVSPPSAPKNPAKCPKDTLKFGVCGSWLGLVTEVIGTKPSEKCCTLVKGLADLEAALCLCTAIKANVLGNYKLKVDIAVNLLFSACGKMVPYGFVCP